MEEKLQNRLANAKESYQTSSSLTQVFSSFDLLAYCILDG